MVLEQNIHESERGRKMTGGSRWTEVQGEKLKS